MGWLGIIYIQAKCWVGRLGSGRVAKKVKVELHNVREGRGLHQEELEAAGHVKSLVIARYCRSYTMMTAKITAWYSM